MDTGFNPKNFLTTPYQKRVEKPWGYEIIYVPPHAPANGKILHVVAGKRLSLQYHDQKTETLCLIKGKAKITISNNKGKVIEIPMELNRGYFIVPGQIHRVTAISDIDFIEAATPEIGNTYRLQDDNNRPTETEKMRNKERQNL